MVRREENKLLEALERLKTAIDEAIQAQKNMAYATRNMEEIAQEIRKSQKQEE